MVICVLADTYVQSSLFKDPCSQDTMSVHPLTSACQGELNYLPSDKCLTRSSQPDGFGVLEWLREGTASRTFSGTRWGQGKSFYRNRTCVKVLILVWTPKQRLKYQIGIKAEFTQKTTKTKINTESSQLIHVEDNWLWWWVELRWLEDTLKTASW